MKKRGEMMGQPLVMIFALVVGALILIWGIYQVYQLTTLAKEVEVRDYIEKLRKDTQRYYYYETGSTNKFSIRLPQEYTYICFVDQKAPFLGGIKRPNGFNEGFVKARSENIFVYSKEDIQAYSITSLKPQANKNPLCVENKKEIIITSKGSYVEISDA